MAPGRRKRNSVTADPDFEEVAAIVGAMRPALSGPLERSVATAIQRRDFETADQLMDLMRILSEIRAPKP